MLIRQMDLQQVELTKYVSRSDSSPVDVMVNMMSRGTKSYFLRWTSFHYVDFARCRSTINKRTQFCGLIIKKETKI